MHALGTTTIIRQGDHVLMTRRSDVGAWVLPGSHLRGVAGVGTGQSDHT